MTAESLTEALRQIPNVGAILTRKGLGPRVVNLWIRIDGTECFSAAFSSTRKDDYSLTKQVSVSGFLPFDRLVSYTAAQIITQITKMSGDDHA